MLNEDQLNLFADALYQRIVSVNDTYLNTIGKRFAEVGTLEGTQAHQLKQILKYQSADVAKIEKALAVAMGKNIADVQTILETIAKDNLDFAEPYYTAKKKEFVAYAQNKELIELTESLVKTAKNDLENLTKSTAVSTLYKSSMTDAVIKAQLGLESYNAAIKSVIREVGKNGLNYVDYESGYRRRLDTSVRQNVLYAMKQANLQSADIVGKQFGADGYEISAHLNCRPSHLYFQGRQYSDKEYISQGVKDRLNDYNCLHFSYRILLNVSEPAYTEKELKAMNDRNEEKIMYHGKERTRYDATQIMRRMETQVRANADALVVAKSAKNKELQNELTNANRLLKKEYSAIAKKFDLTERGERMRVVKVDTADIL